MRISDWSSDVCSSDLIGLWLCEILELPTGDVESEIASACADTMFDVAALSRIEGANAAWATKTALEHCDIIARWRAASGQGRASALADLLSVFRTGTGAPRTCAPKLMDAAPDHESLYIGSTTCRGRG